MRTKEEAVAQTKQTIFKNIIGGALHQLAEEQYRDCLTAIAGKERVFADTIYMISQADGKWTIESKGVWGWMVSFRIDDRYDGVYEEYIKDVSICYNEFTNNACFLGGIVSVVADILTTYHPDGRKLDYPTQE